MKRITHIVVLMFISAAVCDETSSFMIKGAGIRGGYVDAEDIDGTWGAGTHLLFSTGKKNIYFHPTAEFWRRTESAEILGTTIKGTFSELSMNLDGRYAYPIRNWDLFAGAGLGFMVLFKEAEIYSDYSALDSLYNSLGIELPDTSPETEREVDYELGINICGGMNWHISKTISLSLEAKYKIDGMDTFKLTGGISYLFGGKE